MKKSEIRKIIKQLIPEQLGMAGMAQMNRPTGGGGNTIEKFIALPELEGNITQQQARELEREMNGETDATTMARGLQGGGGAGGGSRRIRIRLFFTFRPFGAKLIITW
tara:strand:+ start:372 stop:695 length:324 start_codon:yes stop_codon:yes gene_type:complete